MDLKKIEVISGWSDLRLFFMLFRKQMTKIYTDWKLHIDLEIYGKALIVISHLDFYNDKIFIKELET